MILCTRGCIVGGDVLISLCELYTYCVIDFVFVFALTMADGDDKKDDQLQDMQTQIEELSTNMKTLHE
jgi:hypothetical protein